MGSQQKETTYKIKIQALAENFDNIQKQLKSLNKDGSLDNYAKKWDAIGKKIEKLKEVSNQPESKGMFGTLGRDIGSVEQRMKDFSKDFVKLAEELSKTGIHILDKAEIEKVNKLTSALEALEKTQKNAQSAIDSKKKERQGVLNRIDDANRHKGFLESKQKEAQDKFDTGIGKKKTNYTADLATKKQAADEAAAELKRIQEGRKRDEERAAKAGKKRVTYQDKYSTAKFKEAKKKRKDTKTDYDTHKASWTKEDEKAYKDAQKDIESYSTKIKNCGESIDELNNKAEKLQEVIDGLISDKANQNTDDYVNAYKEMLSVLGKSETEITELSKDFKDLTPEQKAEEFEKLKEEIVNLRTEALAPAVRALEETKGGLEGIVETVGETKDGIKEGAEAWEEYTEAQQKADAIKDRIKDFVGMAGAAKVLKSALRDAYATIKELDAAMAEIAVVTDFSVGDMWEQLPTYTESANDLGVAIHEVYEASALYYQQGLKTEQVTAMTTETLKMMKIAGLSAEDATNRMTAAIRGFNMELNETSAQRVADVYAELAAITASDTGQISTAMTKTASIASSAGMEFETTAAFLAQIIETTQESAETAGTAMKTVIARFQELKKNPNEIGEVDGEIVDANAIETALRSIGVALRDSSGQFRELDDVFLELSGKWDSLDKNTQRYIATIAAGSRQQSRFIAMMSNNARTTELVAAANASAGASNKQYEKTLETMESKLQRLNNAWDEFTMGIINSTVVKTAVDLLTSVINTVNKLTSAFGESEQALVNLGGAANTTLNFFSKIGLLLGAFNLAKIAFNKFSTFVTNSAKNWGKELGKGISDGIVDGVNKGIKKGKNKFKQAEKDQKNENNVKNKKELKEEGSLEKVSGGLNNIGMAATAAGIGIGMVGEMLAKAGFTEASEAASKLGMVITTVGSVFSIAGTIVSAVTSIILASSAASEADAAAKTKQGLAQLFAGKSALFMAVCIMGITIAIIAAIALIVIFIAYLVKLSKTKAEDKLKKASEAIKQSGEAAKSAAKEYEEIKSALDSLETVYSPMEDLLEGTEAWNKALQESNKQVLELIEKFPQLREYITWNAKTQQFDIDYGAIQSIVNKEQQQKESSQYATMASQLGYLQLEFNNKQVAVLENFLDSESGQEKLEEYYYTNPESQFYQHGISGNYYVGDKLWKDVDKESQERYKRDFRKNYFDNLQADMDELVSNYFIGYIHDNMTDTDIQKLTDISESTKNILIENENAIIELIRFQEDLSKKEIKLQNQILAQAKINANTTHFTSTENQTVAQLIDNSYYRQVRSQVEQEVDEIYKEDHQKYIRYAELTGTKYKDGKLIQGEGEEEVVLDYTIEQITESIIIAQVGEILTASIEAMPSIVQDMQARSSANDKYQGLGLLYTGEMAISASDAENLGKLSEEELKNYYNQLSTDTQKIIGGYETFKSDLNVVVKNTERVVEDFKVIVKDFKDINIDNITNLFTGDWLKNLINNVEKFGDEVGAKFISAYDTLLGSTEFQNLPKMVQTEFLSLINTIDINDEAKLERVLAKFGVDLSSGPFADFLQAIKNNNNGIDLSTKEFNNLTKSIQQAEAGLQKIANLEFQREQNFRNFNPENGYLGLTEGEQTYINAQKNQLDIYKNNANYAKDELIRQYSLLQNQSLYGQMAKYIGIDEFGNVIKKEGYDAAKANLDDTQIKNLEKWMSDTEAYSSKYNAARDAAREIVNTIQQSADESEALRVELSERMADLLVSQIQDQIDIQEEQLEVERAAFNNLIEKAQQQIDENRQARQNEENRQNLNNTYNQLSLMQMDTAGSNQLGIAQLEEDIQQQEQDYQDTLIDQALQNLQDSNEKAFEQREQQIALQKDALEAYQDTKEFQSVVSSMVDDIINSGSSSKYFDALKNAEVKAGNEAEWSRTMNASLAKIVGGVTGVYEGVSYSEYGFNLTEFQDKVKAKELESYTSEIGKVSSAAKNNISKLTATDDKDQKTVQIEAAKNISEAMMIDKNNQETITEYQSFLKNVGVDYLTEEDFYANEENFKAAISDPSGGSYFRYIANKFIEQSDDQTESEQKATEIENIIHKYSNQKKPLEEDIENQDSDFYKLKEYYSDNLNNALATNNIVTYKTGESKHYRNSKTINDKDVIDGVEEDGYFTIDDTNYWTRINPGATNGITSQPISANFDTNPYPANGTVFKNWTTGNAYYLGSNHKLYTIGENESLELYEAFKKHKFKTGGLADFTGPAWLDGTKSRPEYVLNADQTERFFSLIDVLEGFDKNKSTTEKSGDSYIDVDINVESIASDYDVEKLADKIRSMIYDDATYRNVNNISHIR